MNSVQKKFFEHLDDAANDAGFEVVVQHEWGNSGTLHLQTARSFDTWLSIPYVFHSDHAAFGWQASYANNSQPVFIHRPNPRFAGFTAGQLGDAIFAMIAFAKEQRERGERS